MNIEAKRSALVVGTTGFIGTELVKLLCNSEEYGRVKMIVSFSKKAKGRTFHHNDRSGGK